ncbi:uncharacterized protein BX664DRAFT_330543 [Halteromyces radiatus]|uniref:uncharacterized protein n=1 Tax=Halteromyces radiatus TaxID=101107 RepID=UPI0022206F4A|nr:uncharacterized protein BX664DRAFT_330543 [Halteromyces radiatus]KAI8093776.1 hypothetical protein BX664DRAFT_330543 [Halteromyces radiatus]
MDTSYLGRRYSRTSLTDDEDQHNRMSDIEECPPPPLRRRSSSCTSIPASPSTSSYKMSIDSDDARSISSTTGSRDTSNNNNTPKNRSLPTDSLRRPLQQQGRSPQPTETSLFGTKKGRTRMNSDLWTSRDTIMDTYHPTEDITTSPRLRPSRSTSSLSTLATKNATISTPSSRHSNGTPERRFVRRTSLLPKSKALTRVMHQAEEEVHLADLEMRRENSTTQHLKSKLVDDTSIPSSFPTSPPLYQPWSSSHTSPSTTPMDLFPSSSSSLTSSPMAYQCSKLNPEIEMTNFQFENLPAPMQSSFRSVKRKASEDRLIDNYTMNNNNNGLPMTSLKRRAVSPSISLSGSPILSATLSSPPQTSLSSSSISSASSPCLSSSSSGNAAARAQQKGHSQPGGFNLYEASGGLSRMSLSE